MKINGAEFPEIKTEYDFYSLKLEKKEYKLLYRIRQYVIVPEHKVKNLKKHIRLKKYGVKQNDNTVIVAYYQPYAIKQTSLDTKKKVISKILNLKVEDTNLSLEEHIEKVWYRINAHKTTTMDLRDHESSILEVLTNYYLGGVEGEGILTYDMSRTIKNKEIATLSNTMNMEVNENEKEGINWEYRKTHKGDHSKKMSKLSKRYKNSKSYKLNNIYSYDDKKDKEFFYDWITEEWKQTDNNYHYNIQRLINPEEEYTSVWCEVDTKNNFMFKNRLHHIDSSVEQYREVKEVYLMDRILVIEQFNNKYFLDQNLNPVESNKIKTVGEIDG